MGESKVMEDRSDMQSSNRFKQGAENARRLTPQGIRETYVNQISSLSVTLHEVAAWDISLPLKRTRSRNQMPSTLHRFIS